MNVSGGHLSKEFFELVKAIGESRSKQEEDRIILAEIVTLKQRLNEPQTNSNKMREYLVQALYVEMLGHDASFAYIHAVKSAQDKNLFTKRTGYLACSLCLHSQHELLLLLINTIQKDLCSTNPLEVAAALGCVCKLLNDEMVPAVFPSVLNLLATHTSEMIRKKCCMVLYSLHHIQPQLVIESKDAIRRALCDPDPSVMNASLYVIHMLAKENKEVWRDLVPSLVSILKQITEHRLPRDFDYHRISAPWIQIKLLSLLATLGEEDRQTSEQIQEILVEVLKRAESGANIGFAIIYECVKTITSIHPSSRLLNLAATSISRFISADNHNLKYVGITGLAAIVRVHPAFAGQPEHQIIVLDCLEDADETLKRRTLELLYQMTNPVNVIAVVDKLLLHLRASVDVDFRRDLVSKIVRLADRFAPSHIWFVRTMNSVFEMGGNLVAEETAHNILRLVAEGPTGNDEEDETFRRQCVNEYISLAEKASSLPDMFVKVIAWVIGEYGSINTVPGYEKLESLLELLCGSLERACEDKSTRRWILSAIIKLAVLRLLAIASSATQTNADSFTNFDDLQIFWPRRDERLTNDVKKVLQKLKHSGSPDMVLRCREVEKLVVEPEPGSLMTTFHLLKELFPYDGACEDIQVDTELSFLNDFIQTSLKAGSKSYCPIKDRKTEAFVVEAESYPSNVSQSETNVVFAARGTTTSVAPSGLKFTPYAPPTKPPPEALLVSNRTENNTFNNNEVAAISDESEPVLKVSGPRKWGPLGYQSGGRPNNNVSTTSLPASKTTTPPPMANKKQPTARELAARALFSGLTPQTTTLYVVGASSEMAQKPTARLETHSEDAVSAKSTNKKKFDHKINTKADQSFDLLDLDSTSVPMKLTSTHLTTPTSGRSNHELMDEIHDDLIISAGDNNGESLMPSFDILDEQIKKIPGPTVRQLPPLKISTTQVGLLWNALKCEKRITVPLKSNIKSIKELFQRLEVFVNFSIVEIIGIEGLAALGLLENPVFIHSKIRGDFADFIYKGHDVE